MYGVEAQTNANNVIHLESFFMQKKSNLGSVTANVLFYEVMLHHDVVREFVRVRFYVIDVLRQLQ